MFEQSVSAETIVPGAALSFVPSYLWYLSLRPLVEVVPALVLGLRQDLLVDGLAPPPNPAVGLGDLRTTARVRHRMLAADIEIFAEARLLWPVSLSSRLDARAFTPMLVLGAERRFALGLRGGTLTVAPLAMVLAPVRMAPQFDRGPYAPAPQSCFPLEAHLPAFCTVNGNSLTAARSLALALQYVTPVSWLSIGTFWQLIVAHDGAAPTWSFATPAVGRP